MEDKYLTKAHNDENFWAILALTRFLLAIIIVVRHTYYFTNFLFPVITAFSGSAAVGAFFMISGYSIASSVSHKPKHFYERRLWRIYPSYVFALCLTFLPIIIYGQDPIFNYGVPASLAQVIGTFFFMQGILVMRPNYNGVLWSLTVGEICYCLAPFFRKTKPWLIIGLIAVSSVVYASHIRIDNAHNYSWQILGFPVLVWIWLWLLGFAYYRWRGNWRWVILLLPTILFYFNNESGGFLGPFTVCTTALLLTETVKFKVLPVSLRRLFLYLGDLSYPLYLVHIPTMNWVVKLCGRNTGWLQYTAIFLVSALILKFIVRPSRRIGDRSHIDQVIDQARLEAKQIKTA